MGKKARSFDIVNPTPMPEDITSVDDLGNVHDIRNGQFTNYQKVDSDVAPSDMAKFVRDVEQGANKPFKSLGRYIPKEEE